MAQWQQVALLPSVHALYGPHFPLDLRMYLASWIEAQHWDQVNEADGQSCLALFDALRRTLEERICQLSTAPPSGDAMLVQSRLSEHLHNMVRRYSQAPGEFVRVVRVCLAQEREELARAVPAAAASAASVATAESPATAALQHYHFLPNLIQENARRCSELQQLQESFIIQYQEFCKVEVYQRHLESEAAKSGMMQPSQELVNISNRKKLIETQLASDADVIVDRRNGLSHQLQKVLEELGELMQLVLFQPLELWQQQQQRGTLSEDELTRELDSLQLWAEHICDLTWKTRQHIRQAVMLKEQLPLTMRGGLSFTELMPMANNLISLLVHRTFVVDKQPPRVLKTQTKFATSTRLLVGSKLNLHMDSPEVCVTIVNERQARAVAEDMRRASVVDKDAAGHGTSGDLLNNRKVMTYLPSSNILNCAFKNMSLRKIKRSDNKADHAVTEEKFSLLFKSTFRIAGGELDYCVQQLSLPLVVVVHGNQTPNAEATILWDNAFAERSRIPFTVPAKVPWVQLAPVLNAYFSASNRLPLSDQNLEFMAQKLLRDGSGLVTWQSFNKESLPGRNFTFWEWFYGIVDLTRKHLSGPWSDGSIAGFINKQQAQQLLETQPNRTFLLRFSDSEVGGVTVAWVDDDETGLKQVWNLQPWFAKDFQIRALPDRIHDLPQLQLLYPSLPKDAVFSKYYTPVENDNSEGSYVMSGIAAVIPNRSCASSSDILSLASQHTSPDQPIFSSSFEALDLGNLADFDPELFVRQSAQDL
eukprot:m.43100 g.43100  ORF g.43100 m.43100 type:complete len:761 (-) comp6134_c0_seq2:819-3101(-)